MVHVSPPGYAPWVRVLIPLLVLAIGAANTAYASDFWDDVRRPGRAAARALGRDARHALAEGRNGEALAIAKRIISLDPDSAGNHVILGRVLSVMSHHSDASGAYRRALTLSADALDGTVRGGDAARSACRAGDYALAAAILRRLVSHVPAGQARGELFALQGDVLLALGPDWLQRALTAYEHALRDITAPDAMLELGLSLAMLRAGHRSEALERTPAASREGRLSDAVRRMPLPPAERRARLAMLREIRGDRSGARRAWKLAAQDGPWATVDARHAAVAR